MRKYIYTVLLIMISITAVHAQRMLPKQKGLEIHAGSFSPEHPGASYYINLGLTINGKKGNYQLWALEYAYNYSYYKNIKIPLETYTAESGYSFMLLSDARKNITLNTALSGVIGYETINRGINRLPDGSLILNKEAFIYGAAARLSLETYLSDRLVFLIQGKARMLWNTSRDRLRPSAGFGLRFNF